MVLGPEERAEREGDRVGLPPSVYTPSRSGLRRQLRHLLLQLRELHLRAHSTGAAIRLWRRLRFRLRLGQNRSGRYGFGNMRTLECDLSCGEFQPVVSTPANLAVNPDSAASTCASCPRSSPCAPANVSAAAFAFAVCDFVAGIRY